MVDEEVDAVVLLVEHNSEPGQNNRARSSDEDDVEADRIGVETRERLTLFWRRWINIAVVGKE